MSRRVTGPTRPPPVDLPSPLQGADGKGVEAGGGQAGGDHKPISPVGCGFVSISASQDHCALLHRSADVVAFDLCAICSSVLEMKRRNPKFGCLRAAQQMSYALGVDVNTDVVRRILQQHCAPGPNSNGPSWLTALALAHAKDSLWSLGLFRCESITLRSCGVLAIIDVFSRRFVGLAVEHGAVDGPVVCRMFNRARAKQSLPKYLSTDPDPLFRFHRWLAHLRVLDVEEVKSLPYSPVSHPFVKRGPRHQQTLSFTSVR
jgi:hypothetical protein